MSKGINKVILVGNLGQDPEVRYTTSGGAVANISVATTEEWKNKQSGEKESHTEWHRVVAFGRLAEIMGEYLKKGSQVYIEGKIQTRKWQDNSGADRYTTEIVASEMQMLGGNPTSQREQRHEARNVGREEVAHQAVASQGRAPDFDDDDIPF